MTNEFNFDVKHEDYKEWLNQIEQVSDADCSLLSEPDPYTKFVCSPEIQKSAAAKMDANGYIHAGNISAYWIPQITLQREIFLGGQSIPSPDITNGKLISSVNWNE